MTVFNMGGNPKDSPWRSTRSEARNRKKVQVTLAPETIDALRMLARDEEPMSRVIERLILDAAGLLAKKKTKLGG